MFKQAIWFRTTAVGALLLMLGACGGGSDSRVAMVGAQPSVAPAPVDAFLGRVQGLIGHGSDNAEPEEVGSAAPTMPEDAEPAPAS
jgi:hypothetical protein